VRAPLAPPPLHADLWTKLRLQAEAEVRAEPLLRTFLQGSVLRHDRFEDGLSAHLAAKLADGNVSAAALCELAREAFAGDSGIVLAACTDLIAICERDPACADELTPFLYFKGFHALQWYRVYHWLWRHDRASLADYLQSRVSEVFAADIHPAARLGSGIFIDHATGVVIGETAVVSDNVSILQNVTLGGTGKEHGDRHPKIGPGVLIGAGATILGNIRIGEDAKIGAGSVVLRDVPAFTTVAGVPAHVVSRVVDTTPEQFVAPALTMDQYFPDYEI
jgi:serine O-acetyltransferase